MSDDGLFAGRYKLERRLGVGGMATVQLAMDTRLERHVAVKLLAEHLAEDSNFVSRFRREALAAARLVHPNIVQVFDFGLDEATHRNFIVMEFVDGPSCAEILRQRGTLPADEAVDILGQSCRGLDYAHRHGVVHRDVKPGNLLLNRDEMVKLADFGIAKAAEQSDITKVGSVLGTAAYLAPEQARGEPAGPASDLYALGVVAYQLMAGRLPYDAASLTDLARLQEAGPPPRLDELADVPSALALAVARALHRDPTQRYADAAEMETALRDGLRGRAPEGGTEATWLVDEDETAATRAMSATSATSSMPRERPSQVRRPLEPLDEPPPRTRAPRRAPSVPPPGRRGGGGPGKWIALLVVLALAAAGFAGYQALPDSGTSGPELRENVSGNVNEAVDELRGLIEDNTAD
ncbi:MAG TPA: protein kinase [Solirubrobacteraceae bacterium]|jgi:serine/threonine-protein kinase|nr:protein kinase [Solirubrobacteraceae bacterium]